MSSSFEASRLTPARSVRALFCRFTAIAGAVPLALCLIALSSAAAIAATASPPQPFSATSTDDLLSGIATAEDRIFLFTPAALYRFLPESEAWTVTSHADGLPDAPLRTLYLSGENIWITGDGVSVSDIRFDDWQRYREGDGFPGRYVRDVEEDDDYAYAGTDKGAGRFDRYILEWETLEGPGGQPLGPVSDVAVGDERVWFGLENGVAEYRKESESFRIDSLLGGFHAPEVRALRQSAGYVWAFTDQGIARYDKNLETWTSFPAGTDLPDAKVHQLDLMGDDIWIGTDAGLWRYRSESGIWRRDESNDLMPGERVLAFAIETDRIWAVTDRAFAVYENETARWIDFTASVPLAPTEVVEMHRSGGTILFVGHREIVYGLDKGQENPSLFTYRSEPIAGIDEARKTAEEEGWRLGLDDAGLGARGPGEKALVIKGGTTLFIEDDDGGTKENGPFGEILSESRLDLTLGGRLGNDRTLSGFYDTTDPENSKYQITYRGARSDVLRVLSAGEIEQNLFNSSLAPGTGLRGATVRAELGGRSDATRRRLLTADGWIGKRRTLPGREVFYGGSREVEGTLRDNSYLRAQVFPRPDGWEANDLRAATLYVDDGDSTSDNANTEHRSLAGSAGSWDVLAPNVDYVIGPDAGALILSARLSEQSALVAVRGGATGIDEEDLTHRWSKNRYFITTDRVPGSLRIAIVDSTGSSTDIAGDHYLQLFGLDENGDLLPDPNLFSPISGLLSFPEDLPFPGEVYDEDDPSHLYDIEYSYRSTLSTFRLSHGDVVPQSERITVDRTPLQSDVDYSFIPSSGLFILFEHVLLDDDTVIEVEYLYEVGEGSSSDSDEGTVLAGQIGFAPSDHLFFGANMTKWSDDEEGDISTTDLNGRFEWKEENRFLRVSPEFALSHAASNGGGDGALNGKAAGVAVQSRFHGLELIGSHRNLGADFRSFEDRRTLLGRLREESNARGRIYLGRVIQAELEWEKSLSDQVADDGSYSTEQDGSNDALNASGEESSIMASLKLLRSALPNLELRRGKVLIDAAGRRQEKWISRAELELSPDQAGVTPWGIQRLWLRAFLQRSDREFTDGNRDGLEEQSMDGSHEKRTTDHGFARLNGTIGSPLSWNLAYEDRMTRVRENGTSRNDRRLQDVDLALQTQPHSSVDAFLRWESSRDQFWHVEGGSGGFEVRRQLLGTVQLYPGRLYSALSRLSFRLDAGSNETESGEPGIALPGASSLFREVDPISLRLKNRNNVVEGRAQLLPWMRLVERWEMERKLTSREGMKTEGETNRLENRLEMTPRGGLVILRAIGRDREEGSSSVKERRVLTQWDQTWGYGFLTYLSVEAKRTEAMDRDVGDLAHLWNPQTQITWRRSRWQLDASLGGSLSWERTRDISIGAADGWHETRRQTVSAALSAHPFSIMSTKLEYSLSRSVIPESGAGGSSRETDHDIRIRIQIRA